VIVGIVMVALALVSVSAWAQETRPAAEKEGVSVTVYNGGYGVVRETRKVQIGQDKIVKFTDVAKAIDATSVHFKSITDPEATLEEQNYQFDLVSADKLLQKYIEKQIEVVTATKTYAGQLMSFDGAQLVLKESGGITMVQRPENVRDIRFKELPEGLLTKPTLVWLVDTDKPGAQNVEVSYQTGGLNWHAEYVMVLGGDDTTADLTGWVSVENGSGKTYTDAKMKFIAGDVRRVQNQPDSPRAPMGLTRAGTAAAAPMEEKAFFEYHMYTLPRPSTVADSEIKQLEMFPPVREMKVSKRFLYNPNRGWRWGGGLYSDKAYGVTGDKKVAVFIEFENAKTNGLGIPLPAGKVRVYKQDPGDKALEFIGEEQIDHTPTDEQLSLQIGNAFDIVGERRQTEFKVETGRKWMSESFEIKIRNHKKEAVVVRVKEPMYRWNQWKITNESHKRVVVGDKDQLDAFNVAWDLKLPAGEEGKPGETVLTYTVEYTW
jgi:hypothetical protein